MMLTSWARQQIEAEALAAGVAVCLPKPVRPARLLEALCGGATVRVTAAEPPGAVVTPAVSGPDAAVVRVLVADDNLVNQTVIRRMLHRRGCHVDVVSDGVQAVRAARASAYDLVFMDCHMPGMDGFEATRVLRTDGCRVPIIAFTADAVADNRERCTAAGMEDCITKPVSGASLDDALLRWSHPSAAHPA